MNAQPAPVVSGRYISGDRPFECTHKMPLELGGISSKAGAETAWAEAGPATTPAKENPALGEPPLPKAALLSAFRNCRRENECIRFFQSPDMTWPPKKVWLGDCSRDRRRLLDSPACPPTAYSRGGGSLMA